MDVPVNEGGIFNWDVLCAALLHDAIEDTQTTAEELTKAFGKNVIPSLNPGWYFLKQYILLS